MGIVLLFYSSRMLEILIRADVLMENVMPLSNGEKKISITELD